ncbi:LuxR C-terminal-related transcriptional regulator [Aulosira sp. FACHB-615]|uniref:LuxR C-terminal-related transcriptional regulator n=1 Tax=Aulosira sp. FACHB-615 TaxID=2692777 RepID=UPI0016868D42|nr:hypothetical protein [Aulosira sp. FACHB-615]
MSGLRCLTPKEKLVCKLLVEGLSYKEIALRAEMGLRTVNSHTCNIYSKLGINRKSGELLKLLRSDIDAPATNLCQSKEQRLKVYQLKKEGFSVQEIAVKLRITPRKVYSYSCSIKWLIKTRNGGESNAINSK